MKPVHSLLAQTWLYQLTIILSITLIKQTLRAVGLRETLKHKIWTIVKEEVKENEASNPKLNRQGRKWNDLPIPFEQPLLISGGIMKPYQIEGMIWMANLRKVKANGILADEMGLGKTLQTISLFCHTYEVDKNAGPFLVIAPLSTLLNWKREVERFAPGVPVKVCNVWTTFYLARITFFSNPVC